MTWPAIKAALRLGQELIFKDSDVGAPPRVGEWSVHLGNEGRVILTSLEGGFVGGGQKLEDLHHYCHAEDFRLI